MSRARLALNVKPGPLTDFIATGAATTTSALSAATAARQGHGDEEQGGLAVIDGGTLARNDKETG